MSRRTKLLITALFLVLLAIPVVYLIHTWHPENPLRFRCVREYLEEEVGGGETHWIRMEVRNTSDVTVTLLRGTFHELPDGKGDPLIAEAHVASGQWRTQLYAVPPGGTLEVEFSGQSILPADTIKSLRAGEWRAREGSVHYAWLSRPKVRLAEACLWLSKRMPVKWVGLLPELPPFNDLIEVEHVPQLKPTPPSGAPHTLTSDELNRGHS